MKRGQDDESAADAQGSDKLWLMLTTFFLALALLGSAILAPIIAGGIVLSEPEPTGSRGVAWLGISIGIGNVSTVPFFTLVLALHGQAWGYKFAPLLGLFGLLLGIQIVRVHLRRLRGVNMPLRPTAYACIAFGLLVAVVLTPVITGASPPAICGEFGAETCGPGDFRDYARTVVPLLIMMGLEAWLLLHPDGHASPMP